ncbi:uncharacterized protein [Ptychodera flava]|uniref:uncharacterized protein n=1 Tax=Ptychodera flava TaxID=63121 RepID=UPI003969EA23
MATWFVEHGRIVRRKDTTVASEEGCVFGNSFRRAPENIYIPSSYVLGIKREADEGSVITTSKRIKQESDAENSDAEDKVMTCMVAGCTNEISGHEVTESDGEDRFIRNGVKIKGKTESTSHKSDAEDKVMTCMVAGCTNEISRHEATESDVEDRFIRNGVKIKGKTESNSHKSEQSYIDDGYGNSPQCCCEGSKCRTHSQCNYSNTTSKTDDDLEDAKSLSCEQYPPHSITSSMVTDAVSMILGETSMLPASQEQHTSQEHEPEVHARENDGARDNYQNSHQAGNDTVVDSVDLQDRRQQIAVSLQSGTVGQCSSNGCEPILQSSASSQPETLPEMNDDNIDDDCDSAYSDNSPDDFALPFQIYQEWMEQERPDELRPLHQIPPKELDDLLEAFISNAKQDDGEMYSTEILQSALELISDHLQKHKYTVTLESKEFVKTFRALERHRAYYDLVMKWSQEGERFDPSSTRIDLILWRQGMVSCDGPHELLTLMWLMVSKLVGTTSAAFHKNLSWGDVILRKSYSGKEYIKFNCKSSLKKRGQGRLLYASMVDTELCPVQAYKEYRRRRHSDANSLDCPFYLQPLDDSASTNCVWFSANKGLTLAELVEMSLKVHEARALPNKKFIYSTAISNLQEKIWFVPENSVTMESSDLHDDWTGNIFKEWLKSNRPNDNRQIHKILYQELEDILRDFVETVTRKDGDSYSVETLQLVLGGIYKHLAEHNYPTAADGKYFVRIQQALRKKKYTTTSPDFEGSVRKFDLYSQKTETVLVEKQLLGLSTPFKLFTAVWFMNARLLGSTEASVHKKLRWNDVSLAKTEFDKEYVVLQSPDANLLKTEEAPQRLYAVDSSYELCPVTAYKLYAQQTSRITNALEDDSPFYFAVNEDLDFDTDKCPWFVCQEVLQETHLKEIAVKVHRAVASLPWHALTREKNNLPNLSDKCELEDMSQDWLLDIFKKWLKRSREDETRAIREIPHDELDFILQDFVLTASWEDGSPYSAETLKAVCEKVRDSWNRDGHGSSTGIPSFDRLRKALLCKQREERTLAWKTDDGKFDLFALQTELVLRRKKILGVSNPKQLLTTVWFMNSRLIGTTAPAIHHDLYWSDVTLFRTKSGTECIEIQAKYIIKKNGVKRLYANKFNPELCPVNAYKVYAHHRQCRESKSPFYMQPVEFKSAMDMKSEVGWYSRWKRLSLSELLQLSLSVSAAVSGPGRCNTSQSSSGASGAVEGDQCRGDSACETESSTTHCSKSSTTVTEISHQQFSMSALNCMESIPLQGTFRTGGDHTTPPITTLTTLESSTPRPYQLSSQFPSSSNSNTNITLAAKNISNPALIPVRQKTTPDSTSLPQFFTLQHVSKLFPEQHKSICHHQSVTMSSRCHLKRLHQQTEPQSHLSLWQQESINLLMKRALAVMLVLSL